MADDPDYIWTLTCSIISESLTHGFNNRHVRTYGYKLTEVRPSPTTFSLFLNGLSKSFILRARTCDIRWLIKHTLQIIIRYNIIGGDMNSDSFLRKWVNRSQQKSRYCIGARSWLCRTNLLPRSRISHLQVTWSRWTTWQWPLYNRVACDFVWYSISWLFWWYFLHASCAYLYPPQGSFNKTVISIQRRLLKLLLPWHHLKFLKLVFILPI